MTPNRNLTPRRVASPRDGNEAIRPRRFRKHRGPCGQPAVVGEIGCLRPVPLQAVHSIRINATPSDLPFKSTGFATYPTPLQLGHSSGSTPLPPHRLRHFARWEKEVRRRLFCVTKSEQAGFHRRSILTFWGRDASTPPCGRYAITWLAQHDNAWNF